MPRSATNDKLVLSGLAEVALGALSGWPFALAVSDPERARRYGIRSTPGFAAGLAGVAARRALRRDRGG